MVPAFWNATVRAEKGDLKSVGELIGSAGDDGCGVRIFAATFPFCGCGAEKIVLSVGATIVTASLSLVFRECV